MGNSSTSAEDLAAKAAYRKASGTSFAYTTTMHSASMADRKCHEMLDPKWHNGAGVQIRECLDSPEHPLTIPVFVGFDETGSMGGGPRIIQDKLSTLKGLTMRAGMPDVQLAFGAYGDGQNHEIAPCQVGQFESGEEMEEWLNNIFLEGNGGGNGGETAGLLLYFLANFTKMDSLDKRGKKGYIFLTGDEIALNVTREELKTYLDVDSEVDYSIEQVVEMAKKNFNIFFFLCQTGADKIQGSEAFWKKLLGSDHVITVEDLDHISELTAALLAAEEGIDMATIVDNMKAVGSDSKAVSVVGDKLAAYSSNVGGVAKTATAASGGLAATATTAADRL